MFGFTQLSITAIKLESCLKSGKISAMNELVANLLEEIHQAQSA